MENFHCNRKCSVMDCYGEGVRAVVQFADINTGDFSLSLLSFPFLSLYYARPSHKLHLLSSCVRAFI